MAKNVCIIGAGITGLSLTNTLTQSDVQVLLLDRNPYPGGRTVFYGTGDCKGGPVKSLYI